MTVCVKPGNLDTRIRLSDETPASSAIYIDRITMRRIKYMIPAIIPVLKFVNDYATFVDFKRR